MDIFLRSVGFLSSAWKYAYIHTRVFFILRAFDDDYEQLQFSLQNMLKLLIDVEATLYCLLLRKWFQECSHACLPAYTTKVVHGPSLFNVYCFTLFAPRWNSSVRSRVSSEPRAVAFFLTDFTLTQVVPLKRLKGKLVGPGWLWRGDRSKVRTWDSTASL